MTGADDHQIPARRLGVPEVVTFPDVIDVTNALDIGIELIAAFGPQAAVVIADLTTTGFCDSSGVRYLIVANDVAAETGAELRVVITSASVLRVMQLTGADQILRIYGSMTEALSGAPALTQREAQRQPPATAPAPTGC